MDDNTAILEIVSELISAAGYQPMTATGGRECLSKIQTERPDLVLLDINMPDMDGWSVLRTIKEKGLAENTKIMMLTATTEIGTDIFGLQDVVSGYIRKPFNNDELAVRFREILGDQAQVKEEPKGEKDRKGLRSLLRKKEEENGMEVARSSAKVYELRRGFSYLVKETKPNKSFEIFVDQVTHNIQGLCVTRQHPTIIRKEWGLEKTPIIWLSNQLGKVYVNPSNIGILSDTIIRFVEKSNDGVILIDGIEFLIVNNDFDKVLRMVHHVTEAVMENRSRLIVSVDPRTLETRELALLERNMEIIEAEEAKHQ
ncbi:MAG: acetoacetate metabolism regulatory protein AtoC [Methanomassiliicoccales archaeon PtaB.Bin215]|nr:MAG: acetoacetate metabolism regulatory protein AtoC [Methanomassiliicoccales archaeon PtaB.Bin215]